MVNEQRDFASLTQHEIKEQIIRVWKYAPTVQKVPEWTVRGICQPGSDGETYDGNVYVRQHEDDRRSVWFDYKGRDFEERIASDLHMECIHGTDTASLIGLSASKENSQHLFQMAAVLAARLKEPDFDPDKWWEEWSGFMGNASLREEVYAVFSELVAVGLLYDKYGSGVKWNGPLNSACDIETPDGPYDVKSTLSHKNREIHVNNRFQAKEGARVLLVSLEMDKVALPGEVGPSVLSLEDVLKKIGTYNSQDEERARKILKNRMTDGPCYKQKFLVREVSFYKVAGWPSVDPRSYHPAITVDTYRINLDKAGIVPDEDWTEALSRVYDVPKQN